MKIKRVKKIKISLHENKTYKEKLKKLCIKNEMATNQSTL
jgi:hypothetical protein